MYLDRINYFRCPNGFETTERFFDFPYFLYVHSGKGIIKIDGKEHSAKPGDLFYCPPFIGNTIIADEQDPFILSGVDFHDCDYEFSEKINVNNNTQFLLITMELVNRCSLENKDYENYTQALFVAWIYLVIELSKHTETPLAEQIKNYIVANLESQTLISDISKNFSYHKNYINAVFKKNFGTTIKQFQISLKINNAAHFLSNSDYSISEIAQFCGFSDINYFSRCFKNVLGVSPTDYRKIAN